MSTLAKYWTMTGAVAVLFLANSLLLLLGDTAQGFVPVLVALLFVLLIGLATYSQLMIRCPRCSTRITGLVDTRDGMSRDEAARYIGVGVTKFDEMVADGRMPRPKRVDGRVIWDRLRVEAAFTDLPDDKRVNPLDRMLEAGVASCP